MKNLFLLNRSGMSPDGTSRKGRYCLDPILSRFSLASLICLCMLTVGVEQMWGATYTYRLVISKAALTDGGKYILLVNGRGTAYKGTVSSGHLQTGLTFSSSQTSAGSAVTTTNTADKIIYVTLINMSGDKYKILDSNGKYITTTGATSGKFSLADADSYGWTFYGTSGMDAIYEHAFSSKYASMRSYNNATFRSYQAANHTSPSSSGNKIYLATGCTVTYDGNGSTSGTVPEDAYLYGEGHTVTVKSNSGTLAKTGYTFSGWNTRADGTGTNYTAGSGTFTVPSNTTSITLYAKWVAAGTSVSYSGAATTNGSFTLSPASSVTTTSSAQTVTVSCSPDPGYYVSSVSATNPSTGTATPGGSGNARTIEYSSGANGTSTISVTFSPIWELRGSFTDDWVTNRPLNSSNISDGVGTISIDLEANTTYFFKFYNVQESAYYKNEGKIVEDVSGWDFTSGDGENTRLFTGKAGTYTFKFTLATKYLQVIYPTVTDHPNSAYNYFKKNGDWGSNYYVHWWDNSEPVKPLNTWGYDHQITKSTTICGNDYIYFPILTGYPNLIVKDNAGNTDNKTGDLSSTGNGGKYHDGASWKSFTTYTISYNKGTGSGAAMGSETDICPGSGQALSPNTYTKDHYHFTGWIADRDVTINSATVTQGTLITGTPTIQNVQSNIALTAQWEINSNTLTWNWGGGSTTSTSYTLYPATSGSVNYNAAITKPANGTMSKTGYTFSSWSSNATTMPDEDLTITAQWTAKTTSITLNKNNSDASGSTAGSASWTYDQTTKNSITAATRTGYNVDGYYTAASDGTKILNADGSLAGNSITVDAVVYTSGGKWAYDGTSLTLYAHWTLKTTTVSFNQNSGTGGQTTTKTATYSQAMPTPITTPTRAGYTFTGYFENSGGTGTKYYNADGSSATNWNKENATWTLYAGWAAKEDTYKTALHTGESGWTSYASGVTKSGAGYTIPAPSSVTKGVGSTCEDLHYHFAGWVADDYKGSPSGHIITATGTTDATGTTYWAVWEKEAAGGGGTSSITITRSTTGITATGYGSGVERTWTQSEIDFGGHYIMTNNANTPSGASASQYIVLQKNNGTLYNTEELPGAITEVEVIQYSELACNVYCGDERLMASDNTSTGQTPSGTLITKPDDATTMTWTISASNNYRFFALKAYTSSSSGTNYITSVKVTYSTITYEDPKAVCDACVATPSISGVSLTGSSFSTTSVPVQATGASAGDNCSLASYGFYWGTSASPTTNNTASDNLSTGTFSATLTGTFTIGTTYYYRAYATNEAPNTGYSSDGTFTLQNVTFNMHSHGGDAPATQVVPQGGKATDPGDPSETGYTFDGWWDNSSYTGSAWDFSTNTVGSGGVTLHAKWTEKPKYTITLNAGNGTVTADGWTAGDAPTWTKTQANGDEEITFPAANPGCAGWVFKGWKQGSAADDQGSFTPDKTTGATLTPTSNVTYYAVYRQSTPSGTTYSKITSVGDLATTDYAIIAAFSESGNYYAMKNAKNGTYMQETSFTHADSWTNSDADYIWKVLVFGDKVAFYNADEEKFLTIVNGVWELATDGQFFTYSFNSTTKAWTFSSPSGKQLTYSTQFYVGDSQNKAIYLYKRGEAESGNYFTNPSCSDIAVNGVANPAAGGTVQLTATAAKSGDKVWACYTADEDYNFTNWSISGTGASLSSTSAQFTEITVGSADVTATANFTAKVWRTVTWKANGVTLTGGDLGSASVKVENGHNITTLPPTPTSCDDSGVGASDQFVGWVVNSENWGNKINDVSAKHIYKRASQFPVVSGDVTYHAVWAASDNTQNHWEKVTDIDDVEAGFKYAIISFDDAYYLKNTDQSSAKPTVYAVTKTSGNINYTSDMEFTASEGSYGGFVFTSVAVSGVKIWGGSANDGVRVSTTSACSDASDEWYMVQDANYGVVMTAVSSKYLATYGTTDWRNYSSPNAGNRAANLHKYAYGYKQYMTLCCDKAITIAAPSKTGSGTVTFTEDSPYPTCLGETTDIHVNIAPTNGYQCTALAFSRADGGDIDIDPDISVPFTAATDFTLTVEQNANTTLNTMVTFVALIDHYIDNMHYNTTQNKSGNYGTAPTLSDESKGEQCTGLHYKFIGWIPETDMNMTTGVPTTTANMVAGGATGKYATGTNYYAIWAEEE